MLAFFSFFSIIIFLITEKSSGLQFANTFMLTLKCAILNFQFSEFCTLKTFFKC